MRLKVNSAEGDCETTKTPPCPPIHFEKFSDRGPPLRRDDRHPKGIKGEWASLLARAHHWRTLTTSRNCQWMQGW